MTEQEKVQPDMKLEVAVLGVSDVDRAKAFYGGGSCSSPMTQQAPQGRALCGLGTAEALFRRGSRGLQISLRSSVANS